MVRTITGCRAIRSVKDFNIAWSHSQDPNANPGTTFSASVNAGTSSFYQNSPGQNGYNLESLTQNNLRSSIILRKNLGRNTV
jgi:hypothetical protein